MGPEVARDEVVQAEPSREIAGWTLHAWVRVGGCRVCQLLLCTSSSAAASRWRSQGPSGSPGASRSGPCPARPRDAGGGRAGRGRPRGARGRRAVSGAGRGRLQPPGGARGDAGGPLPKGPGRPGGGAGGPPGARSGSQPPPPGPLRKAGVGKGAGRRGPLRVSSDISRVWSQDEGAGRINENEP